MLFFLSCYQIIKPQDKALLCNDRGLELLGASKFKDAIEQFTYAVEISPEFAGGWNNLGLAYFYSGDNEKAVAALKKALECDYKFPEARNNLGVVLKNLGSTEEAKTEFKRATKLNKDYADPYFHLGVINGEENKWEKAREYFENALDREPDFVEAGKNLGITYIRLGMIENAITRLRLTLAEADSDDLHDALGYALFLKGDFASALEEFDRAIAVDSNNQAYRLHRGIVLIEIGRMGEAQQEFLKARNSVGGMDSPVILLSLIKLRSGDREGARAFLTELKVNILLDGIKGDRLTLEYAKRLIGELDK